MNTRWLSVPSMASKRVPPKPTLKRGSRITTSVAWPRNVTVDNSPARGATAPSVSHRNRTPKIPTPPVSRPGSNCIHSSLTNSAPPPCSGGASGRAPPMHKKPSPGRDSNMSSTTASRSGPNPSPSPQHNAAAVAASSAARSAVNATRPPRPAHNTNTVNITSTGISSTSSSDTDPDWSPSRRPAPDRAPPQALTTRPPRPSTNSRGSGLAGAGVSSPPSPSEGFGSTEPSAQPDTGMRRTDLASTLDSAVGCSTGRPCSSRTTRRLPHKTRMSVAVAS